MSKYQTAIQLNTTGGIADCTIRLNTGNSSTLEVSGSTFRVLISTTDMASNQSLADLREINRLFDDADKRAGDLIAMRADLKKIAAKSRKFIFDVDVPSKEGGRFADEGNTLALDSDGKVIYRGGKCDPRFLSELGHVTDAMPLSGDPKTLTLALRAAHYHATAERLYSLCTGCSAADARVYLRNGEYPTI